MATQTKAYFGEEWLQAIGVKKQKINNSVIGLILYCFY